MIKNTFMLLNGISSEKEKRLWKEDVADWDSFIKKDKISGISKKRKLVYNYQLYQAKRALMDEDTKFFSEFLPQKEHWRLYNNFKDSCVFLDIEVSCVSGGYITCMTLYDGYETMTFVRDNNLDFPTIKKILSKYKMIITFNGSVFDIPFLRKLHPNLIPQILSWDLRHSCALLGLNGGLKQVEKELGIKRENIIVERMYGGDPLKLWKTFLATGDRYYLNLLVEYNQEDTVNLKFIADKIFKELISLHML